MISLLLTLVIYGLVFWLLYWALGAIALPEPFNKVARVILIVVAVIFLINLVLGLGSLGTGLNLR